MLNYVLFDGGTDRFILPHAGAVFLFPEPFKGAGSHFVGFEEFIEIGGLCCDDLKLAS